jgi:hypothetical protein
MDHKIVRPGVFELVDVDGEKFAKFVLAVLWRASISSRPDYANVSLGPYTGTPEFERIASMLVADHFRQ